MWFQKKKTEENLPTKEEVIEAIFGIFSEEEIKSMTKEKLSDGSPDPGLKQLMIDGVGSMKPRYSVEESVEIAREIARVCRDDLLRARSFLLIEFTKQLFKR